jgi:hypothetical protein
MATQADGTPAPELSQAALAPERPIENLRGEFSRKMGSLEQKFDQLLGYVAQQEAAKAPPAAPAPAKGTHAAMSNDELWELAKNGDKAAFDTHQKRMAAQTYQELRGQENHQSLVDGQIGILHGKYPVLGNPQHALTQTVAAAQSLLQRRGYPNTSATYLEAVKTAIADRPDLVAELHTQGARAREGARRVSAGNSGVTGATVRQDEPSHAGTFRVTPEQAAIAKRMNIKDPAKALLNFAKRQETGESKFGAIGAQLSGEF